MTIAEKLQIIANNEEIVYQAGYEKGLSDLSIEGKKFTTGSVTFTTSQNKQIVTHNLGVVPSIFVMYPIDTPPESETDEAKGNVYASTHIYVPNTSYIAGMVYQGNSGTGAIKWSQAESYGDNTTNTKTTFQPPYYRNYKYVADFRYGWIAIE